MGNQPSVTSDRKYNTEPISNNQWKTKQNLTNTTIPSRGHRNSAISYNTNNTLRHQLINDWHRDVVRSSDTINTLDWHDTDTIAPVKGGSFNIKDVLGLNTYYSEALSNASEYDVSKFKGGYTDSEVSAFGTNTNNMQLLHGGADSNMSELANVRRFIEQELQSGGGDIIRGVRTHNGGGNDSDSNSADDNDASESDTVEEGRFYSESDSPVIRGYRQAY